MHSIDPGLRQAGRRSWDYVRAAQGGDAEAFGYLYRRYRRDIYVYLLARTRSVAVAEDLTSETFLRVLRKLGSVREETKDVRSWITTIARNLAVDHHRCLRNQLRVDFTEALVQLTPPQRKCLFLRFYCGLSVSRTADAMGSSRGAVRAMQYRAMRELATLCSVRPSLADPVRGAA